MAPKSRKNTKKTKVQKPVAPEMENGEIAEETPKHIESQAEGVETPQEDEDDSEGVESASVQTGSNSRLRAMMDQNFIEYASYVIKDRAIPDVDDGLKPVQRRILWALFEKDDGSFHKVANIIGETMKYHPHGDASIGDALVNLANKETYIEKQGNFAISSRGPLPRRRAISSAVSRRLQEMCCSTRISRSSLIPMTGATVSRSACRRKSPLCF